MVVSIHNLYKKSPEYITTKSSNGVWCNIAKAASFLNEVDVDHHQMFKITPGTKVKIIFWKDMWCGLIPFR